MATTLGQKNLYVWKTQNLWGNTYTQHLFFLLLNEKVVRDHSMLRRGLRWSTTHDIIEHLLMLRRNYRCWCSYRFTVVQVYLHYVGKQTYPWSQRIRSWQGRRQCMTGIKPYVHLSYEQKRHDPGHRPWPGHHFQCPDLPYDLNMRCDMIMPWAWILTYPITET